MLLSKIIALGHTEKRKMLLILTVLRSFGPRGWGVAALGAAATLLVIGIPTVLISNPFFTRTTQVRTQDYIVWGLTAVLVGLIAGTYVSYREIQGSGKVVSGGLLSFLAVGCPICNKLIVLALGVSGALTYFDPIQIYLGIASLLLLGWALRQRVQAYQGKCVLDLSKSRHD